MSDTLSPVLCFHNLAGTRLRATGGHECLSNAIGFGTNLARDDHLAMTRCVDQALCVFDRFAIGSCATDAPATVQNKNDKDYMK